MVDKSTGKVGITCRNRTEKGRGVQVSNLVPGGARACQTRLPSRHPDAQARRVTA